MRYPHIFLAVPLLAAALSPWSPAAAQVNVDPKALEGLSSGGGATAPAHPAPHRAPVHRPAPAHRPATESRAPEAKTPEAKTPEAKAPAPATKPAAPQAAQPLPTVPPAAPVAPVIPPPVVVPTAPQGPPPPIPVAADAPGVASPIPGGTRVTFGADRSDLNPATQAALTAIARQAASSTEPVTIIAHAPGLAEDPSTPRRLSLSRALAARAVLINQGITSSRIYVRALGPTDIGTAAPDRVDVVLGALPAALPASAAPPPASPPAK